MVNIINQLVKNDMKKKYYYLLAFLTLCISATTVNSVKRALFIDTRIAYSDPTMVYVYGADGGDHLALCNFYPKTEEVSKPSGWSAEVEGSYGGADGSANVSHTALNANKVINVYCDNDRNNLCPLSMTGVFVITSSGQVIPVTNNPF